MSRRQVALWIVVVALLGGCGRGSGDQGPNGPGGEGTVRQEENDALARYDAAVLATGGSQALVPVEQVLTSRIGDWDPANADDNEGALRSGQVIAIAPLPAAPQPTGVVTWDSGATHTVPLIPADEALSQLKQEGTGRCRPDCVPLEVTGARLTTVVSTDHSRSSHGPGLGVRAEEYGGPSDPGGRCQFGHGEGHAAVWGSRQESWRHLRHLGDHNHVEPAVDRRLPWCPRLGEPNVRRRL